MAIFDLLGLKSPQIMGILNLTPDSFYDGGKYGSTQDILDKVGEMLKNGASIIDIGAYSSRPNAKHISEKEETQRLLPVIKLVVKEFPTAILSVDTFRSEIAKKVVALGAHMINDISGGNMDNNMFQTIAELQVPYILMHMQGNPQNMQDNPTYKNITEDVKQYFQLKLNLLNDLGAKDVMLDVGFGFGKTLQQNYELLRDLNEIKNLGCPILVGISRKSMLYKVLETTPDHSLNATSIAHTIALLNGADILRVHDVKEAVEVLKICNQYTNS